MRLLSCRACRRFIKPSEVDCPFCGAPVAETFNAWAAKKAELAAALAAVDAILASLPAPAPARGSPKRKRRS